ncbi:hypothetical protein KA005_41240, partial [bacterium]|nr:hypothetical protein [bacterium]
MNLPGTYPPEKVDGFIVNSMMTPSKRKPFTYPCAREDVLIKDVYEMTEKRVLAVKYLIKHAPCDLYM